MHRLRLGVRILLVLAIIACVAIGISAYVWTRPYVLTGSYPNGQPAWEQWERRTLSGRIEHVRTVRWYPNGQKAFEGWSVDSGARIYWAPDGAKIDDPRRWAQKHAHRLLPERPQDPESKRPFDGFLQWWNGC